MKQQTLAKTVSLAGVGLHTGQESLVTLTPAEAGAGVRLARLSGGKAVAIPVKPEGIVNTTLCTELANAEGFSVKTIEHLFSALHGMGVDNVVITVDGGEIPILDGSALPWVELIEEAGIVAQEGERAVLQPRSQTLEVQGRTVHITQSDALTFEIDFSLPIQGMENMQGSYTLTPETYKAEIAPARTFCRLEDVEMMRQNGLIKGGTLDCACVFKPDGTVENPEGLRFDDEPVRHKILDAIGDFYVAGQAVRGGFTIPQPGHGINNLILRGIS